MRLHRVLDKEIHIATQRFLNNGVSADVDALYQAIQRSNSSLKRRPKNVVQSSLERVLEFIQVENGAPEDEDSDAEIERRNPQDDTPAETMNRSLRANLASAPRSDRTSPTPQSPINGDDGHKKRRMANGEAPAKRSKSERSALIPPGDVSLYDLGGIDEIIDRMQELLVRPLLFPHKFAAMRVKVPKGVLLHGPPGCGKTMIVRACAATMGLPLIEILGPSIVSGMSGESEKGIRERFDEAKKNAPCIIFMDEIDAIAPKRDSSQSQMEKRIVAQLLVCMDELDRDTTKPVIVLATTNRPDSIDPALRRGGRFDTEINIPVPNESVREHILRAQTREAPVSHNVDFKKLANMTAGFVGSDLHDLVSKAGSWQLSEYFEAIAAQTTELNGDMDIDALPKNKAVAAFTRLVARARRPGLPEPAGFEDDQITMEAFEAVLPGIIPSSKREGFATIPDVSWDDIGALKAVREELQTAIVEPIKQPELYAAVGISAPTGVLLWGPPGCGKTLLAKAVAAESKANFISIKGPELLNKFVGESEAAVRKVFSRARSSVPCVIFFDELDALVPRRDESVSEASARVVNTLLTELDGLSERQGIYVIAATNRPDIIDEAMLRPGRLETLLFVDLPDPQARVEILQALLRAKPVDQIAEVLKLAGTEACKGFSGADLQALLRQAGQHALHRKANRMRHEDFVYASQHVTSSVGNMAKYYKMRDKFGSRV